MAPRPQSATRQTEDRAQILDRLLRCERTQLLRQVRFHSRRPEDAEDALSDACVQFLRFYDGPAGTDALRWMLVVTKRCAWAIARRNGARESRIKVIADQDASDRIEIVVRDAGAGPAETVERSEETAEVVELIERLKPDERTALILFGLGCSYAEIGELRGWSATKVRRCIQEGRACVGKMRERGDRR